jgi:putative intracellular protease/amidase
VSTVLIPLPDLDSDPTEVAVSWRVLVDAGHRVVFATESGAPARADEMMLTGRGLDVWAGLPGLKRVVVVGRALRARRDASIAYRDMASAAEFRSPISWAEARVEQVDGLLLPGGHRARGMRAYLESPLLQRLVADAFTHGMPVAAVCHGVLLAARSTDPATGRSVLHGRKTPALTWTLERKAWRLGRVVRFWDPDYYRTYSEEPGQPDGFMSVQAEVTRALASPADFLDVPAHAPDHRAKTSGMDRDSAGDMRPAFVVEDGNYLSARWPGDVHTFASMYAAKLSATQRPASAAA